MTDDLATGATERLPHRAPHVTRVSLAHELPLIMDDDVAARLSAVGRTEDIVVAPDGRRLAVAGFAIDRIALIDFSVERDPDRGTPSAVLLSSIVMLECAGLSQPHGLAFVDDGTLLVANRASEVLVLSLPPNDDGSALVTAECSVLVDGSSAVPVNSPGSVAVVSTGSTVAEVVVCNNYAHEVTRHVVDTSHGATVIHAEVLLRHRLVIPDGVAVSRSGEWLAISNHETNQVFVYRYDERLGPESEPDGVLSGINYPHGLQFSTDDRHLFVADAGLPFVHVFAADGDDWSGAREPSCTARVMSDEQYIQGKYNPQEGGPKGLDLIDDAGVVVVTSEYQSLAFFDAGDFGCAFDDARPMPSTANATRRTVGRMAARLTETAAEIDRLRTEVDRLQAECEWRAAGIEEYERRVSALDEQSRHVEAGARRSEHDASVVAAEQRARIAELEDSVRAIRTSTAWRLTAPLRVVADCLRRLRP